MRQVQRLAHVGENPQRLHWRVDPRMEGPAGGLLLSRREEV
jgi:hypothetical protein